MTFSQKAENMKLDTYGGWMGTYTGKRFYPLNPRPEDICIEDIAHHPSLQCRFAGATQHHYSTAQHCVHVAEAIEVLGHDATTQMWGLLHDATETYCSDVVRPLKHTDAMAPYREIEQAIMRTICSKFDLPVEEPSVVKEVDLKMCWAEMRDMRHSIDGYQVPNSPFGRIDPWPACEAERRFLHQYYWLVARREAEGWVPKGNEHASF